MRSLSLTVALLVLCTAQPPAFAQERAAGETAFLKEAAKKLNAFATRCSKGNYPMRAREVWFEIVNDYDTDDEVARENLGYVRVGTVWSPDPRFTPPTEDEPDAAVARILNKSWKSVCKTLGAGHRDLGTKLAAADAERSEYHFQRALRFLPKDTKAVKASGMKSFQGLVGTADELTVLRRSRLIERTIAELLKKNYSVKPVQDGETHPVLEAGGVPYTGVASEHFRVWGDWEPAVLEQAAQNAERALAFCEALLKGFKGYGWRTKHPVHLAFFSSRDTWAAVCRKNESRFPKGQLDFILEHTSATSVGAGKQRIRLAGVEEKPTVNDLATRWPVQQFAGFNADALVEGIGHAVVGQFFGRNLIFTVGQERENSRGTSSGAKRRRAKLQLPDIEVWGELAVEFAHERTDVPAARLAILKAASFPDEGRIKAWAFCDYLLRRNPDLLRTLDKSGSRSSRPNESEVAAKFVEKSGGITLVQLDDDWRGFWTDDTELLRAVKGKKTPLESVSKLAPVMLEEFNQLRSSVKRQPVAWSAEYSGACKQHAEYLKANKSERGPLKENIQDPKKRGYSNAGRMFAPRAAVSTTAKKPKEAFERWLDWPGFRDAILNPQLEVVGLYADSGILVMDVSRGQGAENMQSTTYPNNGQRDIPHAITVKELGTEVAALLKKHGKGRAKEIGYPVSNHFFRSGAMPKRGSIECKLLQNGKDQVDGVLHIADGGKVRRAAATGLVVFYAYEPLKRGMRYTVEWSYTKKDGTRESGKTSEFWTM